MTKTRDLIEDWQARGFAALQALREQRCSPNNSQDDSPSTEYLPILAYYMDHSILVLNANALRDFVAANTMESLMNPCKISRQTVEVACRSLNLILTDPILLKHMYGTHNNQLIMICHASSEILFVSHCSHHQLNMRIFLNAPTGHHSRLLTPRSHRNSSSKSARRNQTHGSNSTRVTKLICSFSIHHSLQHFLPATRQVHLHQSS
jgi:hypothetical protein